MEEKLTLAFKYKCKVSNKTHKNCMDVLHLCKNLYNGFLEERINAYNITKRFSIKREHYPNYFSQSKQLPEIKKIDERYGMYPSNIFQDVCDRLNKSYQNFFRRCKKGETPGFPKFKSIKEYNSFCLTYAGNWFIDGVSCNKIHYNKIIPENGIVEISKIGKFKLINYNKYKPKGIINNIQVKLENDSWYIIIFCDEIDKPETIHTGKQIGIDVGVVNFIATSDGELISNPKYYTEKMALLKREQRKLKNKIKFSNRWKKQNKVIGKIYTDIKNSRLNFQKDLAKKIVIENDYIYIEDLKIKNMSKSASGSLDNPGSNVSQKSGLNRSILDSAWYQFKMLLKNKSVMYDKEVISVNPKHTSQTCPSCGNVNKLNRLKQSEFICIECGYENNADIVGAINILERGKCLTK